MKKSLSLLLASALMATLVIPASASTDAFSAEIKMSSSTICIDAGGEKSIGWVDGFGIGNTEAGDFVEIPDVDFGTTGAGEAQIRYSFLITDYSPLPCTIEMYIDSTSGSPVASFDVENTGHWLEAAAMWFDSSCSIPSGVHTVYIKWVNNTGSLFGIKFTAASASATTIADNDTTAATAAETTASITTTTAAGATTVAADDSGTATTASGTTTTKAATTTTKAATTATTESTATGSGSTDSSFPWVVVVIAVLVLAGGAAGVFFYLKKKKAAN